ncbi:MAG TPA: radical SAM protein, partial [Candidatus Methanoperedenaceae archaeon]|nr:radical SAM protein [Candidatus Methanoperedenaceae archaeon]
MRSIPVSKYIRVMGYLVKNWSAGESIYPVYCSLKLTRRCNFRCSFCNCWHQSRTWKDIPTEDVKRIIDNIASSSVLLCSFEGGEPLVRDDIEELLRYQSTKPFYLLFTTSERRLLTDYPMDRYAKYIDFLHISIDEGHENMEMYDLLEDYTKLGPIVTVQIVVTKDTIDALESKIKRCYETGVKAVVMVAARLQNARDHYPDTAALSRN